LKNRRFTRFFEEPAAMMNTRYASDLTPETAFSYSAKDEEAIIALREHIITTIKQLGSISFEHYMEQCLYHPELGYYPRNKGQNVGKSGDFFTSVSVGPAFGSILCDRLFSFWKEIDTPKEFRIYEIGANTGDLAKDILQAAKETHPEFFEALHYFIKEPFESLRSLQEDKLKSYCSKTTISDKTFPPSTNSPAVFLSNELFDALPVRLIVQRKEKETGRWLEKRVTLTKNDSFSFEEIDIANNKLSDFCKKLGTNYQDGYTTEVCLGLDSFLESSIPSNFNGLFLAIDYGLSQDELYHPGRTEGTLRTYHKHQADDDPFEKPGASDITAHVNFTNLAETLEHRGFKTVDFLQQGRYLTKWGRAWLLKLEQLDHGEKMKSVKEFQTITHPSQLGGAFKVLEMQL